MSAIRGAFPKGIHAFCFILAFATPALFKGGIHYIKMPAANCAVFGVFLLGQNSFFTMVPLAAAVALVMALVFFGFTAF